MIVGCYTILWSPHYEPIKFLTVNLNLKCAFSMLYSVWEIFVWPCTRIINAFSTVFFLYRKHSSVYLNVLYWLCYILCSIIMKITLWKISPVYHNAFWIIFCSPVHESLTLCLQISKMKFAVVNLNSINLEKFKEYFAAWTDGQHDSGWTDR